MGDQLTAATTCNRSLNANKKKHNFVQVTGKMCRISIQARHSPTCSVVV